MSESGARRSSSQGRSGRAGDEQRTHEGWVFDDGFERIPTHVRVAQDAAQRQCDERPRDVRVFLDVPPVSRAKPCSRDFPRDEATEAARGASRAPRVPERSALSVRVQPPEPSEFGGSARRRWKIPACVNAFVRKKRVKTRERLSPVPWGSRRRSFCAITSRRLKMPSS